MNPDDAGDQKSLLVMLTSKLVAAYVRRNRIVLPELATLIRSVFAALRGLVAEDAEQIDESHPAVPVRKSVTPDYLICLEDGRQLKMLKRYLRRVHGMTPDEYRAKWGLPHDYPMTAPGYAARRSAIAKESGLGTRAHRTKGRRR